MILIFTDHDGDTIAIESTAITAVRIGMVQLHPDVLPTRVTLITANGLTVAVAEQLDEVLTRWTESRQAEPVKAHPGITGWVQRPDLYQPQPSSLMPEFPPPWQAKVKP